MFTISDLTVEFGDGLRIFDRLDATLGPGPVALMGPSGSGKTTLLNVLSGRQSHAGLVELDGRAVAHGGRANQLVATVHQDYRLVEFLSLVENVQLGAEARGRRLSSRGATDLLGLVGLDQLPPSRLPGAVSGGEQQRVAIARALAAECSALVADEPTGALDAENTDRVTEALLAACAARGVQLVVATHDDAVARRVSSVLRIEAGQLRPVSVPSGRG